MIENAQGPSCFFLDSQDTKYGLASGDRAHPDEVVSWLAN